MVEVILMQGLAGWTLSLLVQTFSNNVFCEIYMTLICWTDQMNLKINFILFVFSRDLEMY